MAHRQTIQAAGPASIWLAMACAVLLGAPGRAGAAEPRAAAVPASTSIQIAASEATSRFVPLGVGKSVVIDLPRDVKDILVADPKIANAVVRTSRRDYIIGSTVGQTSVFFFDIDGRQIAGLDIAVTRDLNGVRAALRQMFPDSDMRIDGIGDGVVLTGSAASPAEAQQAFDLASRLAGDGAKVVNGITVRGRDQILLKVTVAEVQRDVIKQRWFGFDRVELRDGHALLRLRTADQRHQCRFEVPVVDLDVTRDGTRRRYPHARRT